MARHKTRRTSEHHAPGRIGGRTPQLAVDEICTPTEEKPQRCADTTQIGQGQIGDARDLRRHDAGNERAHKTSVEAHAAFVERQYFKRVLKILTDAIENNVAKTRAHDNAYDNAEHDGEQGIGIDAHAPPFRNAPYDQRRAEKPQNISNAVPAHRERAHVKITGSIAW